MKKTFNFGNIACEKENRYDNLVKVDVEYKKNAKGQMVFSCSGAIWNSRKQIGCVAVNVWTS